MVILQRCSINAHMYILLHSMVKQVVLYTVYLTFKSPNLLLPLH